MKSMVRALWLVMMVVISATAYADDVDAAREEFWKGNEAYQSGDYPAAVVHFEAAYQLAPNARVQEYLGRTFVAMRRYEDAIRAFERAVADDPSIEDEVGEVLEGIRADMRNLAVAAASERVARAVGGALGETPRPDVQLRAGLGTVMMDIPIQVTSSPRGAEVYVDGTDFGSFGVTPVELRLFTGPHRIEVRKPYYVPAAQVVHVAAPRRGESIPAVAFRLERMRVPSEVRAHPPTARIVFVGDDGERESLGMGSYEGPLPAGPGTFILQASGRDRRIDVVVEATEDGSPTQFDISLDERDDTFGRIQIAVGKLRVVTQVDQGDVLIDGRSVGVGPGEFELDLTPGRHTLRVERSGYETFTQDIVIDASSTSTIYVNQLERARRGR